MSDNELSDQNIEKIQAQNDVLQSHNQAFNRILALTSLAIVWLIAFIYRNFNTIDDADFIFILLVLFVLIDTWWVSMKMDKLN